MKLLAIPKPQLYAGILVIATLGAYSVHHSAGDLLLLTAIGVLGYLLRRIDALKAEGITTGSLRDWAEQLERDAGDPAARERARREREFADLYGDIPELSDPPPPPQEPELEWTPAAEEQPDDDADDEATPIIDLPPAPAVPRAPYQLPPASILTRTTPGSAAGQDHERVARILTEALASFGVRLVHKPIVTVADARALVTA